MNLYLMRHGETEWSLNGNHTGLTDLPLTENGEKQAKALSKRVVPFDHVFASPLKRAFKTCEICGCGATAQVTDALLEWNYGDYEGLKTAEIREKKPDWDIFTDGAPNGESPEDVMRRANGFIEKLLKLDGDIALFSSGHFLRAFTTCWIKAPITLGKNLELSTASFSMLSFYREDPVIKVWNDTSHI
ncbi:MAG: Acid phosphatase [Chlamydiia bacterium]|nr:Acid phosphatase [Chlamydiia bacterium]MCH9615749.1 Acid phosphatase [Chlamydiia bacterium]MCH9628848.1 Acid phosphatase [Chlamydiia bacterium]